MGGFLTKKKLQILISMTNEKILNLNIYSKYSLQYANNIRNEILLVKR